MFDSFKLFLDNDQAQNYAQSSYEVEMLDFGASNNTSFALKFKKDVNISKSMSKNEVNLHLMEGLEKTSISFN